MTKDELLSTIFNEVSDRHAGLNYLAEKKFVSEHNIVEVHCIDMIEKIQDPNVTKLAKAFYMTRGAISKITKRLIREGAIETYQKPDNKKEIYYKLTDLGRMIYLEHEKLHRARIERDSTVFSRLTDEEKDILINILEKVSTHLEQESKKMEAELYS